MYQKSFMETEEIQAVGLIKSFWKKLQSDYSKNLKL